MDKSMGVQAADAHEWTNGTLEAPRLKEMSRELSERLRRFGGTGSQQIALEQEAMNHIRLAPDREQAFVEIGKGIDMALERSRGLGR